MAVTLPGPLRFARMAGSSIAAPSAAGWVTDFLNAAYYARRPQDRDVDDLRLAHGIVTTRWSLHDDRRLAGSDVLALHRAYGALRLRRRGKLDRDALEAGARTLLGDWFLDAWADDARRAHGIAFASRTDRDAFSAGRRLEGGALGPITPPTRPAVEQQWSTYEPVALGDPDGALALLSAPARWPDIGAAAGRFTAVRPGGLDGQTFEIEVVAHPTPRSPVFTRGYVTCTAWHIAGGDGAAGLEAAITDMTDGYAAAAGADAAVVLPDDTEPLALIVLTTHAGHFLGAARSHLLVWRDVRGAWIRDVGAWDPLPAHLAAASAAGGRAAQHDFWGPAPPERSMLAQLARVSARGA